MKIKPVGLILLLAALTASLRAQQVTASFWDAIPGVSQLKSLFQAATGDLEGAKRTQENFLNTAPVISQAKSAVQAATGDHEGAKKTQEAFGKNIDEFTDGVPGVGHLKGGIKIALGDKEGGLEAIKSASSSTGAVIGGLVGGPAGAIASGALTDGLISGIDSGVNKEKKLFGVVDYLGNIGDKDSGEHFDQGLGIGFDLFGGKKSKKGNKNKSKADEPSKETSSGHKNDLGSSRPDSHVIDIDIDNNAHIIDIDPPKRDLFYEQPVRADKESHTSSLKEAARIQSQLESLGHSVEEIGRMSDNQKARILSNALTHLDEHVRSKLTLNDFKDVNSFRGQYNCYLCTLAGASGKLISRLAKIWDEEKGVGIIREESRYQPGRRRTDQHGTTKLYRDTEFPDAHYEATVNYVNYHQRLTRYLKTLPKGACYNFGLGYLWQGASGGHIVFARAWLDETSGKLRTLYTDFQISPDNPIARYSEDPPNHSHSPVIVHLDEAVVKPHPDTAEYARAQRERPPSEAVKPGCVLRGGCHPSLEAARERAAGELEASRRARVTPVELANIKSNTASVKCGWCVLALFHGVPESGLYQGPAVELAAGSNDGPTSVEQLLLMFELLGYPDTRIAFSGDTRNKLLEYLTNQIQPGRRMDAAVLVIESKQPNAKTVDSYLLKAWRGAGAQSTVELLITDYDKEPEPNSGRFKRSIDDLERSLPAASSRQFHLLVPLRIKMVTDDNLEREKNSVDDALIKTRASCAANGNKRLIGYVPLWSRHELTLKQAAHFTNLVVAFAAMEAGGKLRLPDDTISKQRLLEVFLARRAVKSRGGRLAVSIAIGGWANSEHFSSALANESQRRQFVANIVVLVREFNFDGVDIDWEYPGTGGAQEGRPEDRQNYVIFMRELRAALASGKLLSLAAGAGEESMRGFDVAGLAPLVDWIGLMSYDFNGAWDSKWGAYVGPNAPLWHAAPAGYSGKLNANWALKQYACRAKTPAKIVMGVPFYGRFWSNTKAGRAPDEWPLFRMAQRGEDGKFGGELAFCDIKDSQFSPSRAGVQHHWDNNSATPWAEASAGGQVAILSYDNDKSIGAKVKYALDHHLGGLMAWSVSQDDDRLTLTQQLIGMCNGDPGGDANQIVNYKCNPLGDERRWQVWSENNTENAGRCGRQAPLLASGHYAHCDPDDVGYSCCGEFGYCGSGPKYCDCGAKCVDYARDPQKLVEEPTKPTRPVQWHVGFELAKPGQPRCGSQAPPLNGHLAICNPDDNNNHCCSSAGYCGAGPAYCSCPGCKDFKKLSIEASMVKARAPHEITWHVGFDTIKPGEPRCGPKVARVNGKVATCSPDDGPNICCSPAGYCGSGSEYCK